MEIRTQGIIEAAVTALVLAAIGYIAIIPRLEERIEVVRKDVGEIKQLINDHASAPGHVELDTRVKQLEKEDEIRRYKDMKKGH